jgi:hypothetical protein
MQPRCKAQYYSDRVIVHAYRTTRRGRGYTHFLVFWKQVQDSEYGSEAHLFASSLVGGSSAGITSREPGAPILATRQSSA